MTESSDSGIEFTSPSHSSSGTAAEWNPLPRIGRAISVGQYSPSETHSTQSFETALTLGDEVYVFETHSSGKWCRGYVVTSPSSQAAFNQPASRNKKINNADLKPLDLNISSGIFPISLVNFKEYFDIPSRPPAIKDHDANYNNAVANNGSITDDSITSAASTIEGSAASVDGESLLSPESLLIDKSRPPPIPALRLGNEAPNFASEPLVDDIIAVIKEWHNTYVYHHFLAANYSIVDIMNSMINELYYIRRKLVYGLVTSSERVLIRKKAIWIIARVSKLLHKGQIVRDTATGSILSGKEGPVTLAQEQILLSLAPNYPDHSVVSDRPDASHSSAPTPKHILVDFKSCIGQEYGQGLSVDLYLRTKTQRLTESFTIAVKPQMLLSDLSAVLFRDLPLTITKDDVFLVAEVYEEVSLKSKKNHNIIATVLRTPSHPMVNGNGSANGPGGPHSNGQSHNVSASSSAARLRNDPNRTKRTGRRGLAAGVADVSRLFREEEKGESIFTVRMFASYLGHNEPSNENRGWGELIDRIIRGRPAGVAVTPRAEKVVCTVKDFEAATVNNIDQIHNQDAISVSKSMFISSLSESRDDIYINLGKASLIHSVAEVANDYFVVSLSSSSGDVQFCTSSNGRPSSVWDSVATFNNEAIGQVVRANGFGKNEILQLGLYIGGEWLAQGSMPLWHGNRVWSGKRSITFVREGVSVATLNLAVDFVGNGFNTDVAIDKVLHWKVVYDTNGADELMVTLARFKVIDEYEFLKVCFKCLFVIVCSSSNLAIP